MEEKNQQLQKITQMEQIKKKKKTKNFISAPDKCRAVLSVWTQSRSVSAICRDLSVSRAQVIRWQEIAMEAMLQALDQTPRKAKKATLNSRLEKLLMNRETRKNPSKVPHLQSTATNAKD